jgi:hypothetical protein
VVDQNGYGLRVPGIVISPYAKRGYIDHQTLSFDAYLKFIEDVFLKGQRLDPRTDGRPDPRPNVRENAAVLGDLARDFDFHQRPRPPDLLPVHPATTLTPSAPFAPLQVRATAGDGEATVRWSSPLTDGGEMITKYVITPFINGVAQTPHTVSSRKTVETVSALRNGQRYTFKVAAVNKIGRGLTSSPSNAIAVGVPTPPRSPSAEVGGTVATITWTAPARDNGSRVTSYIITAYAGFAPRASRTVPATTTTVTFSGLDPGLKYLFAITAVNANGRSSATNTK